MHRPGKSMPAYGESILRAGNDRDLLHRTWLDIMVYCRSFANGVSYLPHLLVAKEKRYWARNNTKAQYLETSDNLSTANCEKACFAVLHNQ